MRLWSAGLARVVVDVAAKGLVPLLLVVSGFLAASPAPAGTAGAPGPVRLIMVEEAGCRFCASWDADVGGAYETSDEGRFAPLLRVARNAPVLASLKPAAFTPTFILVKGEAEVGRITGYPGATYFWQELDELLGRAGYEAARSD
jgi:hypothetical protein